MISRSVLLLLLPVIASFALFQRRRLVAVMGMAGVSLLLAAVYLFSHAPDVAVTEAAIGAALVTFVYVLAIRKTGRLLVVADEAPGLLHREGQQIIGLEQEILAGFCRHLGLDLAIQFLPREEVEATLLRGEADIGAGGIVLRDDERFFSTPEHLPTALFHIYPGDRTRRSLTPPYERMFRGYFSDVLDAIRSGHEEVATLDLARFESVARLPLSGYTVERVAGTFFYTFLVRKDRETLYEQFVSYINRLKEQGELKRMVRRYFA